MLVDPEATATAMPAPFAVGAAHELRSAGVPNAECLYTFRVGKTRPATALDAEALLGRPRTAGRRETMFITTLSVPLATRPDGGTAPSVAETVAALVVVRAIALRHVLGPGSGQRRPEPRQHETIVGNRLVELRKGALLRRRACVMRCLHGRRRRRYAVLRVLDAPSRRGFVARPAGDRADRDAPGGEYPPSPLPMGFVHPRPHGDGHVHPGALPPGPPKVKRLSMSADRL
jgi:hypothetical protein